MTHEEIAEVVARSIRPPERLSVADWADEHRVLPPTSAEPGRWRTDRTPYMREPLDCLTPGSGIQQVVMMKSAQVGGTELLLNWMGHTMTVDPGPGLLVQPTEGTARDWSAKRLTPMIDSTPQLFALFGSSKRNPKNKTLYKEFPGGFWKIAYANSAVQLRSDAIRYVGLDEVDGYPGNVDGEGDAVELAIARTRTFGERKRIVGISTPTDEGHSRIERWYKEGDQRRYHVPCPHCDERFVMELEQLARVDDGVVLECPCCSVMIDEAHKTEMLAGGEWVPTNDEADPRVRSYHINALYSPAGWFSWADVLDMYDKAVASDDPDAMRVFWNTILGLPFADSETEQADWEKLYNRRGGVTRGTVSKHAAVLTAGVDVQGNRLECEIVAWGPGLRSYSVDYIVLPGDPSQPEVWADLDEVLLADYPGENGAAFNISRLAIDTGYLTNHVYAWARKHRRLLTMPVKGSSRSATLIGKPRQQDIDLGGRVIKRGVWLWPVNVDDIKSHIMRWIELPLPVDDDGNHLETPERWCEWPAYRPEYFRGLCGEQLVRKGSKLVWEIVFRDQEPLDCRVYATAAALSLGLDRLSQEKWDEMLEDVASAAHRGEEVGTIAKPKRKKSGSRSSYLHG